MLNYMLIKHKKIFECFNCFWKSFWFEKCQKFQKLCNPVLATWLRVNLVACPQSRAYTIGFRDSLASQSSSHKKDLENFSKIWFLDFLRLALENCSRVEASTASILRSFCGSPRLLEGETSSREKHLNKFFKICVSKVFGLFAT